MPQQLSRNPNTGLTSPEPRQRVWPGRLFLVAILVVVGSVFWQRQAISDWIQLYGYRPPTPIATLARQTTMTDPAKHLFYLNKPTIANKADFVSKCTTHEHTIVLGCYHGGEDGIYLLAIANNSELGGVMQVTAAHETLHAAYERLSESDKSKVNALLQQYYDHGLKDPAIRSEIDTYRKTEPGELLNEMHSIFGTEVANLPTPLEKYYSRYFTNRSAIVAQAARYQTAFRSREMAVKNYDAQLAALQEKINHNEALLKSEMATLESSRQRLEAYKSSNNIASYNAAVPAYNTLVHSYNSLLATTKSEIEQYNVIVSKRNALVVEEQSLVQQLSGESLPGAQ